MEHYRINRKPIDYNDWQAMLCGLVFFFDCWRSVLQRRLLIRILSCRFTQHFHVDVRNQPDDLLRLVEQYSNLKDIGQRVELSEKGLA